MAPLIQGAYEFNKETLVDTRRRMGLSQARMAELLGVPANTLSRWETGITVPDANALSAIISIAKEHGMEPPSFFDLRNTRLRVGSKPLPQSTELLHSCQSLRGYLAVLIEQDSERPSVLRIQIRNTAPVSPDWPKIVFTGVRVSLAHTGGPRCRPET